LLDVKIHRVQN